MINEAPRGIMGISISISTFSLKLLHPGNRVRVHTTIAPEKRQLTLGYLNYNADSKAIESNNFGLNFF